LTLRPPLRSPYPTDEQVIRRIHQAVARKPDWLDASRGSRATAQA